MKVAFIGTHGVGKTTLCYDLAALLKRRGVNADIVKEVARMSPLLARRLSELDHIPFLMLSAYSEQHMIGQATQHGALAYLVKPLDTSQLVPAIEAALARANELQGLRETRAQLQAALDAERDISVATGITMVQHHLNRQDAFELLRKMARTQRRKLAELATEIIRG